MATRRGVLKGTGASTLTIGLAGCLRRVPFVGSDEEDDDDDDEADGDTVDEGDATDSDSDEDAERTPAEDEEEDGPQDPDDTESDESGEQKRDDTDEDNGDGDSDREEPTDEDTEIDRDQYDEHEQPETTERDSDDITITADTDVDDYGGVTVTGTITNESSEAIDTVTLDISFYDPDGEYLTTDSVTVSDIGGGETVEFEGGIRADEEQGEVGHIEIDPTAYDIAS